MSTDIKLNFCGSELTRTEETIKQYIYVGRLLWDRTCRHFSSSADELSPNEFHEYLAGIFTSLRKRTIRSYLAAAREFLHYRIKHNLIPPQFSMDAGKTLETLYSVSASHFQCETNQSKVLPLRTSKKKQKKISATLLKRLVNAIKTDKHAPKWSREAIIMLHASLMTGLRPIEWRTAFIDNENLVVQNAKHTNGRANGITRNINLSKLPPGHLRILRENIKICNKYAINMNKWESHMAHLRRCLRILNKRYLPKSKLNICMYSARHQFAANAKSAGLSTVEVAALMGHISDATPYASYGKRMNGYGGINVSPNPSEVSTVRQVLKFRDYLPALIAKSKGTKPKRPGA